MGKGDYRVLAIERERETKIQTEKKRERARERETKCTLLGNFVSKL